MPRISSVGFSLPEFDANLEGRSEEIGVKGKRLSTVAIGGGDRGRLWGLPPSLEPDL